MGLDLSLLPFDGSSSQDVLKLEAYIDLWDDIFEIENESGRDVPENFSCYMARARNGERAYGRVTKTVHGERLKYVKAQDLLPLASHPAILRADTNVAIWAYLAAIDGEKKIALMWD